jgi:membrane associated rhomboid family serine protease
MLLPLGDDNRDRRTTPWVNYLIIAVNVLVFVFLQRFGTDVDFTYSYSTVPAEILSGNDLVTGDQTFRDPVSGNLYRVPGLGLTPISVYITLLTSMFMHGGIAHIVGNLLFLFIFGDNVEDRLGHLRYLVFYLTCGILASLAHVFATELLGGDTMTPSLGASGAISGVLGGYILLFPRRRVLALFIRLIVRMPAWVAIGLWFVFQLISGMGVFGGGSQAGGVAYAAHIGGFVAGAVLVGLFALGTEPPRSSSRRLR